MDDCFCFACVIKEVIEEVDWTFINENNFPKSEIYFFILATVKVGLHYQVSKNSVSLEKVKKAMISNLQQIINKATEAVENTR